MSLKNKWRRRGRLEFMRVSKRYSDGARWDNVDVLYVRVKGKACVYFENWDGPPIDDATLSLHAGTYRLGRANKLVPIAREYLNAMERGLNAHDQK